MVDDTLDELYSSVCCSTCTTLEKGTDRPVLARGTCDLNYMQLEMYAILHDFYLPCSAQLWPPCPRACNCFAWVKTLFRLASLMLQKPDPRQLMPSAEAIEIMELMVKRNCMVTIDALEI